MMPLAVGDRLGPYRLLAPIGAGGMGEVWTARDTRLGRTVAIKRLTGRHGAGFLKEAQAIAALNHPHICTLHDIGPDYLVMEYVEGEPLLSKEKPGPLPSDKVRQLAVQIAEALAEAHRNNVVHLDLKPGNIMVTPGGSVKLLDFGLAKLTREDRNPGADGATLSMSTGMISGTPAYMSPEQTEGKALDARSDIFSFGAVLYEMLTGRRAFAGDSLAAALAAVLRADPAPLPVPRLLESIVMRCLRKDPGERFQTMDEVRKALAEVGTDPDRQQPSIAVLPFANMSSEPEQEYFSDGLSEEIINALTQIPGLKVIARTSAFAFKGKHEDIRRIAEVLGVAHVLEGSVRKAGNRVRITAQLISAADGSHLWSERYDRDLTDIFAVQDEIAAAIAGKLEVKLGAAPAARQPHTPSLPAYEALLKGRHLLMKQTPDAVVRAKEYYDEAAALDPGYVEPHAALANYYGLASIQGLRPARELMPLLRAEARKILEIDPADQRGHTMLGVFAALYDYSWREAEEHFRMAMSSGRATGDDHAWKGASWFMPLGRFREAAGQFEIAVEADPLNAFWRSVTAEQSSFAGLYDHAIEVIHQALEIDHNQWHPHWVMGLACASRGMLQQALASAEQAYRLAPWESRIVGLLAGLLAGAGQSDRASALVGQLETRAAIGMVVYHVLCGQIEAAADWYGKSIERREPLAAMYARTPLLKPLRQSPRWQGLARMMNLPEATES